jgi:dTDP-4-dehydrorhamnose reductase
LNRGAKVIQIATDCVYSGVQGSYVETDSHDATDVYGKTKSLGEVPASNMMHLRASIIGPEVGRSTSLLEWFRNQPKNAKLNGFTDHLWNGITTHHFAKLALSITETKLFSPGVKHVLPRDIVAKDELLKYFKEVYGRNDIVINRVESTKKIDRTLSSNQNDFSNHLWTASGYKSAPTVQQMVQEQFDFNQSHV